MLCARNILAGETVYDVWRVNQDAEYHEAGEAGHQAGASGLRAVPTRIRLKTHEGTKTSERKDR
jgi:hypothetical protein